MLKTARQRQIRQLVDERGEVAVAELNEMLDVSEATIRRDLEQMAEMGWVRRTHGGAVRVEAGGSELPIKERLTENAAEKEAIARLAAGLVQPGETVFLGSGSTVREMAPLLAQLPNLTVITNSLPVVNALAASEVELIVIGGMLRQSEQSMVGHVAEAAIREFRADRVFMGIAALDVQQGLTSDFLPEALTDRSILAIGRQTVILADHSKFGRVNSVFLAPVTAADVIIGGEQAPGAIVAALNELGVQVMLA